jgi:hypothetical protein
MATEDPWNNSVIANRDEIVTVDGNAYFPPEALVQGCFRPSRHCTVCGWKRETHTTSTWLLMGRRMPTQLDFILSPSMLLPRSREALLSGKGCW